MKRIVSKVRGFFDGCWIFLQNWKDYSVLHIAVAAITFICVVLPSIIVSVENKVPTVCIVGKFGKVLETANGSWVWFLVTPILFFVACELLITVVEAICS